MHVIAVSSYLMFLFLYLKSPNPRDRFRTPLTLPFMIVAPELTILVYSVASSGLWSRESSIDFYFLLRMLLESPLLAIT